MPLTPMPSGSSTLPVIEACSFTNCSAPTPRVWPSSTTHPEPARVSGGDQVLCSSTSRKWVLPGSTRTLKLPSVGSTCTVLPCPSSLAARTHTRLGALKLAPPPGARTLPVMVAVAVNTVKSSCWVGEMGSGLPLKVTACGPATYTQLGEVVDGAGGSTLTFQAPPPSGRL